MMTQNADEKREQIFSHILQECYKFKFIDPGEVFVDSTHVKVRKMQKRKSMKKKYTW